MTPRIVALMDETHIFQGEWVAMPRADWDALTADLDRLRAVERAARALVQRHYNAEDEDDDEAVAEAAHDMRAFWTWYGGAITGEAALWDRAAEEGR